MFDLTPMAKKLIVGTIIFFFIAFGGSYLFFLGNIDGFLRFALGLFVGSVASCIRLIMMDNFVRNSVNKPNGAGGGSFINRQIVAIIALSIAAYFDYFNIFATALMLVSLPIITTVVPLVSKKK